MYYSSYEPKFLSGLGGRIAAEMSHAREVWCIFDNTAAGAAVENAFEMREIIASLQETRDPTASAPDRCSEAAVDG
jgi:uncharacterized protein YecE (DUF72 family)